jgi:hypothetical protein
MPLPKTARTRQLAWVRNGYAELQKADAEIEIPR